MTWFPLGKDGNDGEMEPFYTEEIVPHGLY